MTLRGHAIELVNVAIELICQQRNYQHKLAKDLIMRVVPCHNMSKHVSTL